MKALFRLLRILPIYLWALLLLIMGVSGYWWFFIHDRCTSWTLRHLVKVAHGHRILEARLSGGFDYAPFQTYAVRGEEMDRGSSEDFYDQSDFLQAFNYIRTERDYWPSPKNRHAEAMSYFIRGRLNYGLELLEKASAQEPMNACMLNDLAAAYVARAELLNQPKDLFHALSVIDEAATNEPDKPEIIFNKALILEKLFLWPTARKTWEEFLTIERSPEWQAEARKHIAIIDTPPPSAAWPQEQVKLDAAALNGDKDKVKEIIEKFGHFAYVHALDEMIPQWADSMANNNLEQANKSLTIARVIGDGLVDVQDEHLIKDLVANIDQGVKQKNHRDVQDLIIAHQKLHEGKTLIDKNKLEKAYNILEIAKDNFDRLKDESGQVLTTYYQNYYLFLNNFDKAFVIANKNRARIKESHFINLMARILLYIGVSFVDKNDFSSAMTNWELAASLFDKSVDIESKAQTHFLIAHTLKYLNDGNMWQRQYNALSNINIVLKPEKSLHAFIELAQQLVSFNELHAAKYFYDEAINNAVSSNNVVYIITAFLYRSEVLFKLGNEKAASADLATARQYLQNLSDESYYKYAENIISLREGIYKTSTDPHLAIKLLTDYTNNYKNHPNAEFVDQAYIFRANAYTSIGEPSLAEADLKTAIEEVEQTRFKINTEKQRISFLTSPLSPYDEMCKLQINAFHRYDEGFNYAEASRARALLDMFDQRGKDIKIDDKQGILLEGRGKPFTLSEIQSQIPDNTTLIQYAFIDEKMFIFIIKRHQFNMVPISINTQLLNDRIDSYRSGIDRHIAEEELKLLLQSIYNMVFRPLLPYISTNEKLIIIPDKTLNNISFAALNDETTGKYLTENFTITIAPSASVYIKCLQRDNELATESNRGVLAIGNPQFDRKIFPRLANLNLADQEAQFLKELYPDSEVLPPEKATKRAILSGIAHHTIVHYAGHAIMDANSPLNSKLALAPGSYKDGVTDDGVLYVRELYGQKFPYTRLVLLAACKTASGQLSKGEGLSSIARPFLAAGVPIVIASIWNANDSASEQLFKIFHKQMLSGQTPDVALRNAQIELIHHPNKDFHSPIMWGGFIVLGGSSSK